MGVVDVALAGSKCVLARLEQSFNDISTYQLKARYSFALGLVAAKTSGAAHARRERISSFIFCFRKFTAKVVCL